jgi:chaperone BCS1
MDTVFMNPETKNEISKSIKSFVNRKDWYLENFVPYHYGILLYGPPGTGKSTLIRAIISEYSESVEKQVNIQYLRSIRDINDIHQEAYELDLSPKIIIVEDIDASVLKRRTDTEESKSEKKLVDDIGYEMPFRRYDEKISLSEILNTMDGVSNLENVIYIFTTNHIEHLDPALIRPGRIDKLIKVDLPGRDEYDQFMFYHFKKHIPEDFVVRSHKLIAELQNEIVCERSYEEVLKILGKED